MEPGTQQEQKQELRGALGNLLEQATKMQGMFSDDDGTIQAAINDAEYALEVSSPNRPERTWSGCKNGVPEFSRYQYLEISPCREHLSENAITRCEPGEAEFWTIYGRDHDGLAEALHDALSEDDLCDYLKAGTTQTGLKIAYFDTFNGGTEPMTLDALADRISGWLLDQTEDGDLWENHPLDGLRTALVFSSLALE